MLIKTKNDCINSTEKVPTWSALRTLRALFSWRTEGPYISWAAWWSCNSSFTNGAWRARRPSFTLLSCEQRCSGNKLSVYSFSYFFEVIENIRVLTPKGILMTPSARRSGRPLSPFSPRGPNSPVGPRSPRSP